MRNNEEYNIHTSRLSQASSISRSSGLGNKLREYKGSKTIETTSIYNVEQRNSTTSDKSNPSLGNIMK